MYTGSCESPYRSNQPPKAEMLRVLARQGKPRTREATAKCVGPVTRARTRVGDNGDCRRQAHGRALGAATTSTNARVVDQLDHWRTASPEAVVEAADAVRRRAASRERSALLRAAARAGLSEGDAQRHLVAAGAAARRLGITRERLRQLADAEAIECFKTSLGRVYRSEDLDRLGAAGWNRRQPVPKRCSSIDCNAIALDAWAYMVVPGVEIQISMCASHIAGVVTRRR
jgi:hypothetical protein